MNKEYNNLTVENLIKTEWFNQFKGPQKNQILYGLKKNVDVSIYAKIDFSYLQMRYIRQGLEDNLDVSVYAKPEYSWQKMRAVKIKMLKESTLC